MILRANSWAIISEEEAIKKLDKSALLHSGTGIPMKIRFFFEIEDMAPGENRNITLIYNAKKYKASFNMERRETARTRMFWHNSFSEILREKFEKEYKKVLNKKKIDKNTDSAMVLHKLDKDTYIVTLTGIEINVVKEDDRAGDDYDLGEDILTRKYREFQESVYMALKGSKRLRADRLKKANKMPKFKNIMTRFYIRNPDVVAEVLDRAEGICERCGAPAPFIRKLDGTPYLEVHHKKQLAFGGEDTVGNAIATCPNCHRELHYGC